MMAEKSPTSFSTCYVYSSKLSISGAWNGNRTRTPAMNEAADFKFSVHSMRHAGTRMDKGLLAVHTAREMPCLREFGQIIPNIFIQGIAV